jgi:hypothetical protein
LQSQRLGHSRGGLWIVFDNSDRGHAWIIPDRVNKSFLKESSGRRSEGRLRNLQ